MEDPDFSDPFFTGVAFLLPKTYSVDCILKASLRFQEDTDVCFAFAVVNCIFTDLYQNSGKCHRASEQQLMDCLHLTFPSKASKKGVQRILGAGFPNSYKNAFKFIQQKWIYLNKDYPWSGTLQSCSSIQVNNVIKISRFSRFTDHDDVKRSLDTGRIVGASIYFTTKFRNWKGTNIYTLTVDERNEIASEIANRASKGRHALSLIGYGHELGINYFVAQNTFGLNWGHLGYIKVEYSCLKDFSVVEGSRLEPP